MHKFLNETGPLAGFLERVDALCTEMGSEPLTFEVQGRNDEKGFHIYGKFGFVNSSKREIIHTSQPIAENDTVLSFTKQVVEKLRATNYRELPQGMMQIGLWMARNIDTATLNHLHRLEIMYGAAEVHRVTCQALVSSGRYVWDRETGEIKLGSF